MSTAQDSDSLNDAGDNTIRQEIGRVPRYRWRITKYDPSHRNLPDAYADEWCHFGDVGDSFGGKVLTLHAYERVERRYLNALRAFAVESGHIELELIDAQKDEQNDEQRDGAVVDLNGAEKIARRVLRGKTWCNFRSEPRDFYAHFGDDFYMYIGSRSSCASAVALAKEDGLFVEPDFTSPHL